MTAIGFRLALLLLRPAGGGGSTPLRLLIESGDALTAEDGGFLLLE